MASDHRLSGRNKKIRRTRAASVSRGSGTRFISAAGAWRGAGENERALMAALMAYERLLAPEPGGCGEPGAVDAWRINALRTRLARRACPPAPPE
jgi:hypothetical protein